MQAARKAIPVRNGRVPIQALRVCYDKASSGLLICQTHPSEEANREHHIPAFRQGVSSELHDPEQLLQTIHDCLFPTEDGHFCSLDPLSVITSAGSLFTIRAGTTTALPRDLADPCLRAPCTVLDTTVLDMQAIQDRTNAADVFLDWPLEYMMQSGYTFWCIPRQIEESKAYYTRVRDATWFAGVDEDDDVHTCKQVIEFDREKHVWLSVTRKGLSQAEAEKAADDADRFKVAVELDFSAFNMANMLLFVPPGDAKKADKVMEEMEKMKVVSGENYPLVDLRKMRLVPHPRFACCESTNWFKVVPKGKRVSWEAKGYTEANVEYFDFV